MAFENKNPSKPRQVRGTAAYKYRNLFALSVLAASGFSWFLFELLPPTKRVKEKIYSGYFDRTPQENQRLEMIKRNLNPDTKNLLQRKTEYMTRREDPVVPTKI